MTAMMNIRKKLTAMVIAALVMTALLAITGDWGSPQRRDFRNWP